MNVIAPILFVIAFVGFLVLFAFVADKIIFAYYDHREKVQREKYPDFYDMVEKRDKLFRELWALREDYETIPKEHIDTLTQNEKYVRLADRAHHQEQLEHWRQVLADHEEEINNKYQECISAREEVKQLAELYKIK